MREGQVRLDLAAMEAIIVEGTTHGTADTALATLPVNPFNRQDVWVWVLGGAGVYVEHANTSGSSWPSGITATTIDVRSTNTSEPFMIAVIPIRRPMPHQ